MSSIELSVDIPRRLLETGNDEEIKRLLLESFKDKMVEIEVEAEMKSSVDSLDATSRSRKRPSDSDGLDGFDVISSAGSSPYRSTAASPCIEGIKSLKLAVDETSSVSPQQSPLTREVNMETNACSLPTIENIVQREVKNALELFRLQSQSITELNQAKLTEEVRRLKQDIEKMTEVAGQNEQLNRKLRSYADGDNLVLLKAILATNDKLSEMKEDINKITERLETESLPKKVADQLFQNGDFQNVLNLADNFQRMVLENENSPKADVNKSSICNPLAEAAQFLSRTQSQREILTFALKTIEEQNESSLPVETRFFLASVKNSHTAEELGEGNYKLLIELLMRPTHNTTTYCVTEIEKPTYETNETITENAPLTIQPKPHDKTVMAKEPTAPKEDSKEEPATDIALSLLGTLKRLNLIKSNVSSETVPNTTSTIAEKETKKDAAPKDIKVVIKPNETNLDASLNDFDKVMFALIKEKEETEKLLMETLANKDTPSSSKQSSLLKQNIDALKTDYSRVKSWITGQQKEQLLMKPVIGYQPTHETNRIVNLQQMGDNYVKADDFNLMLKRQIPNTFKKSLLMQRAEKKPDGDSNNLSSCLTSSYLQSTPPAQKKARLGAKVKVTVETPKKKTIEAFREMISVEGNLMQAYSMDFTCNSLGLEDFKEMFDLLYTRIYTSETDLEFILASSILKTAVEAKWEFATKEKLKFQDFLNDSLKAKFERLAKNFALCTKRTLTNDYAYQRELRRFLNVIRFISGLYNQRLVSLPFIKLCIMELHVSIPNVEVYAINLYNEDAVIATLTLIQNIYQRLSVEDIPYLCWLNTTINDIAMYFPEPAKREKIVAEQKKTEEICAKTTTECSSSTYRASQPGPSYIK